MRSSLVLLTSVLSWCACPDVQAQVTFTDLQAAPRHEPHIPDDARFVGLQPGALRLVLAAAPVEAFGPHRPAGLQITLPLPDGSDQHYEIWSTDLMHPDLAAQFPQIQTWVGRGLDDSTATIRLDLTPTGFHAMILSAGRTVYIDPVRRGDTRHYASYFKPERTHDGREFACHFEPSAEDIERVRKLAGASGGESRGAGIGDQLVTFRTAVAATGEYTQFHGGTVALGQAAIVTAINRVTGIYERDLSVRLQLVADNSLVVYTNGATDPYSNNNAGAMLGQNQTNLDAVIGSADYDVGHVFSTGGGGLAGLAVICSGGFKAYGVTGRANPIADPFYVDYVAHEFGHQFGANHTFNGDSGSCTGGNRHGPTAYEPGSGSTIMAYAGICGNDNLQSNSDDYFHGNSIDAISAVVAGASCGSTTPTGNNPPIPVAGNSGFTVPALTPFVLTGSATDPNGHPMTYCWEEFDLGPQSDLNNPLGNAPIFRSWDPSTDPSRYFPRLSDLLAGTTASGEELPSTNRTMDFRLTVRDNLGGVDDDSTSVDVVVTGAAFAVTSTGSATWTAGTLQTIQWEVAGTTAAPISCATVNVLLSVDGGLTYPHVLLSGTPNDGSQLVLAPYTPTAQARVKVEAANNIFFNINAGDFSITVPPCPADLNGDFTVNVLDLLEMLAAWGPNPGHPADLNGDGQVNVSDLLDMLTAWGPC